MRQAPAPSAEPSSGTEISALPGRRPDLLFVGEIQGRVTGLVQDDHLVFRGRQGPHDAGADGPGPAGDRGHALTRLGRSSRPYPAITTSGTVPLTIARSGYSRSMKITF